MTTDAANVLEELRRLSNPQVAHEEELARNRSNFRPVVSAGSGDFDGLGPIRTETIAGNEAKMVDLKVTNLRVRASTEPYLGASFDIPLRLPARPNEHSEITLMVASAAALNPAITDIVELSKAKGVSFEERVHEYTGTRFVEGPLGGRKNRAGQTGDWKEVPMQTRYYHITAIGAAGNNGAKASSPESLAAAALIFRDHQDSERAFSDAVLLDSNIDEATKKQAMDGSLWKQFASS